MQFIKFGIVGFTNTIVGYVIYVVTLRALRKLDIWPVIDIYIAQVMMFLLSAAWSFYWNNKIVFRRKSGEHRNMFAALIKTYVSYAFTSLFLSELLLIFWVNVIDVNEYAAPILNLIITVPLNFLIQRFWAFEEE